MITVIFTYLLQRNNNCCWTEWRRRIDKINKQVIATNSMIEINKRQVDNVKDIDVVINMITTIAVKKALDSLGQYCRDELDNTKQILNHLN